MYACVIYQNCSYKVCYKVTVVDNQSHKVSQMEEKSQDIITKQEGEAKEQKKTCGIWTYFEIDNIEN